MTSSLIIAAVILGITCYLIVSRDRVRARLNEPRSLWWRLCFVAGLTLSSFLGMVLGWDTRASEGDRGRIAEVTLTTLVAALLVSFALFPRRPRSGVSPQDRKEGNERGEGGTCQRR